VVGVGVAGTVAGGVDGTVEVVGALVVAAGVGPQAQKRAQTEFPVGTAAAVVAGDSHQTGDAALENEHPNPPGQEVLPETFPSPKRLETA